MADSTEFDSRPNQISKGSNNTIPLSSPWHLPKPGENKTGAVTGESQFTPLPSHANSVVIPKSPETGENLHNNHKKKDVFRPSVLDMESGRRDRWRDEERDTNSSVRKDRWREGDKELYDNRKVDRWNGSSGRHHGEARRAPGERWADSGNRESSQDQRSKWSTRWGPDGIETDTMHETWGDSYKESDKLFDKGPSHGKDEKDVDHYRPWRSNTSYSQGREEPSHQALTPNKQVSTFTHGRGRGENLAPTFSLGRGRIRSGGGSVSNTYIPPQPVGSFLEKVESGFEEHSPLRYDRTKLLNVYRITDMRSFAKLLGEVDQVPSLTLEEPLEPLAFCTPTPEEVVTLKGIDEGEIVSVTPQITKEGLVGRTTTDSVQTRGSRLGSRNDLPLALYDPKSESVDNIEGAYSNYSESLSHEKQMYSWPNAKVKTMQDYQALADHKLNPEALNEDGSYRKNEDMTTAIESTTSGNSSMLHVGAWRSSSFSERAKSTIHDWREISRDVQKDLTSAWEDTLADPTNAKREGSKLQMGDDSILRRQPSAVFDRELESCNLRVGRGLTSAPADSPFYLLGDVMPHLRAKVQPPPGFSTPKYDGIQDVSGRSNYNSFGKLQSASGESDSIKNEPRYIHGQTTEAENRFLESLMSGSMSSAPHEKFALSEGMQEYMGINSSALPPVGAGSGDDLHLLAKKMTLERQRSLTNPYSHWPGRDLASHLAKTDVNDSLLAHSNLNSSILDTARGQHNSQNVDLMSILRGFPDRSTNNVNNGTSGWLNVPVQGGLGTLQDELDVHPGQNFPSQPALGPQQQRLQSQHSLLSNLLSQSLNNPSSMLTTEKLISSGLSQDPQLLSSLQQQNLLHPHSHAPVASQQLSLLDKLLLLKQQQMQEEQEELVRQQQQLLSHVLSENHPYQRFGESPFVQLQTSGLSTGNASGDHAQFQQSHKLFQNGSQVAPTLNLQDKSASNVILPSSVSQNNSSNVGSEAPSMHLPRQIFGNIINQRNWVASLPEQVDNVQQQEFPMTTAVMDTFPGLELPNRYPFELKVHNDEAIRVSSSADAPSFSPGEHSGKSATLQLAGGRDNELFVPENAVVVPLTTALEPQDLGETHNDFLGVKEVKNAETPEVKKSSAKKSKKQKSSKAQCSDSPMGVSKTQKAESSEIELTNIDNALSEVHTVEEETKTDKVTSDVGNFLLAQNSLPAHMFGDEGEATKNKGQTGQVVSQFNTQAYTGQRAWKPTPGFKPKSLSEIQQEEQKGAREKELAVSEISTSLSSMSVSTPWAGIVANSDHEALGETLQDSPTKLILGKSESFSQQKSQLHDLFWETHVAKSSEIQISASSLPPVSLMHSRIDSVDDDSFIEAKDTKKSRKKSAKAKGAVAKVSVPAASPDLSFGSNFIDKGNNSHQLQQKEILSAVPSGPSLGDFVTWKGESTNPSPAPAWSTESVKFQKPTSLRDILKEQQRTSVPTLQKPAVNQPARGVGPSLSVSSSVSTKAASSIQINSSASSHPKHKVDDDLFWGSIEQPNHEAKQSDFPQLGSQGRWGSKSTPTKGTPEKSLNRQKSSGGRPGEYSLSSSPASSQPSLRGKKDASTKHSEAMDFKEWCENECFRLVGSKDTSFLEFCIKQSRAEAEIFLIENLGTFDSNREFIDKFLNYKDFLPMDVIDIAFKTRNDQQATASGVGDMTSVGVGGSIQGGTDATDGGPKGGKKKGKKGKKVSPSVLGFNVVSNRIMMGEIQTLDD
ncbi:unnamed protein product [Fraxinus pennsylvanica]|uniref:GYF domain-containing protein n=1 Tax=Fraxinus pennsylvanica TaxID=56036 RepID=A0AAD1ZY56_9LAMI|nr:unnamed protein product [Fraxinus pennsylvanica]